MVAPGKVPRCLRAARGRAERGPLTMLRAGAAKRVRLRVSTASLHGHFRWSASSRPLAPELGPEPGSEPHGGLDLNFAYRDALDVQSEGNADPPAKGDQLDRRRDRLIVGRVQGVVSMAQIVRDPARHVDTEPLQELQRLH